MKTINLKKIVESKDLDQNELAKDLFPNTKYPKMALQRILKGDANLDSDQIARLSISTGLSIAELFEEVNWTAKNEGHIHYFENREYKAQLDTKSWITKLWHKEELIHESVLMSGTVPLSLYFETLNDLINNHKNK